jgi:beta-lactamase class A
MQPDRKCRLLVYRLTGVIVIMLTGFLSGAALMFFPSTQQSTFSQSMRIVHHQQLNQPEAGEQAVLYSHTTPTHIPTIRPRHRPTASTNPTARPVLEKSNSRTPTVAWPTPRQEERTTLAQELQSLFDQTSGTFGGIVYDISTQSIVYSHNADLVFSSASLIKIPIVITVYYLANQEILSLDDQIVLQASVIVGGSGSIQYTAPGSVYSVRELCARMMYDSDNTAANMLLDHIGGFAPVNQVMGDVGAGQTLIQRRMMDMSARAAGFDNLTSPADMFLLLQTLHNGTLLGSAGSQEIIGFMQQTTNRQKIPAYLPPDVVVAHKVGSLTGVEHDVGIVWLPDGRQYIVVLMSTALPSNTVGIATLAEASRIVYAYEQQRPGSAHTP